MCYSTGLDRPGWMSRFGSGICWATRCAGYTPWVGGRGVEGGVAPAEGSDFLSSQSARPACRTGRPGVFSTWMGSRFPVSIGCMMVTEKQRENLRPFVPGDSRINRAKRGPGRPRKEYREALAALEPTALAVVEATMSGRFPGLRLAAAKDVLDRLHPPKQEIAHTGGVRVQVRVCQRLAAANGLGVSPAAAGAPFAPSPPRLSICARGREVPRQLASCGEPLRRGRPGP